MVTEMTRHEMREYAFLLTYERIFNNDDPIEFILESARESDVVEVTLDKKVEQLFRGVDEKKESLDARIAPHLKNWSIQRISKVSLAVLRLAVYEILYCDDIDIDIAISEAVKIAQAYTLKDDVSFINGVLSSISKEEKASDSVKNNS